jgi:hypothetical protein
MRRTPLQQIGDRIGMYAYLTAIGGRQLWPRVRNLRIEEQRRPSVDEPSPLVANGDPARDETPIA